MQMAESIWKVSSNASNINHIIISIHGYNQFTFNVSIILLFASFGCVATEIKPKKLPLSKAQTIHEQITSLDIVKNPHEKQMLFDFVTLFQTYQSLMKLPAAQNKSICDAMTFDKVKLKLIEEHLKIVIQNVDKSIRDQKDLNENTLVCWNFLLFDLCFNFLETLKWAKNSYLNNFHFF